jgi:hypothetical protein
MIHLLQSVSVWPMRPKENSTHRLNRNAWMVSTLQSGLMAHGTPDFEWYDAWILAAVVYASDGAEAVPLWRVVGVADGLNKAIVSRDELELALARLTQAGYVRVVPDGFAPTQKAITLKVPGPPVEYRARHWREVVAARSAHATNV